MSDKNMPYNMSDSNNIPEKKLPGNPYIRTTVIFIFLTILFSFLIFLPFISNIPKMQWGYADIRIPVPDQKTEEANNIVERLNKTYKLE